MRWEQAGQDRPRGDWPALCRQQPPFALQLLPGLGHSRQRLHNGSLHRRAVADLTKPEPSTHHQCNPSH
ncbi:hypothetical protein VTJ04DRAFT_3243 [Mycothermus thermophilus]|uniref:uncharacterized protein n=1 Tax=Humicola insolens TaxID=85995 RepID=UPI003744662F